MKKSLLLICFALQHATGNVSAATLWWNANTEADLAGYNVYGESSATNWMVDVGLSTSYPLTNSARFQPGTQVNLYVTAYNRDGIESDPSDSLLYVPELGLPPVPTIATNHVTRSGNQWKIDIQLEPIPPAYAAGNFQWRLSQGGKDAVSGATTNTALTLNIPVVSPSFFYVWTTNHLGISQSFAKTYAQPKRVGSPSVNWSNSILPPPPPL